MSEDTLLVINIGLGSIFLVLGVVLALLMIILYTDGLTEAASPRGELFSARR